jgi:hypothetical protein
MKIKTHEAMPRWKALFCCTLAVWALLGCANSSPGSRRSETVIDRIGVDVVASDSTRQLTYLKESGSKERFCRGPGADAITTASQGVSAQIPLRGSSVGVGEETTNGAVDLGGRNPAVLITRELMYRACELASNTNADGPAERQIYMQFLQVVLAISKVQTGTGITALASEPAAPVPFAATAATNATTVQTPPDPAFPAPAGVQPTLSPSGPVPGQ